MNKAYKRNQFLRKRGALNRFERIDFSLRIAKLFFEKIDLQKVKWLHHYVSIPEKNEVETAPIFEDPKIRELAIKTAVPRMHKTQKQIEHVAVAPETLFAENKWGIREPVGGRMVSESLIDIVVVPLLAFDGSGNRIGYGGGYYDKFLAKTRPDCIKAGLSFFPAVDEMFESEPHDIALDCCVTPKRFYDFRLD